MNYAYAATTSSYSTASYAAPSVLPLLLILSLLICYLIAWVFTMQIVTKGAREKGYENLTAKLWFIGLFGLVFTPAIIVAALPDKKLQSAADIDLKTTDIKNELPSI